MDLARKAQYFTLDVISDLGYGRPLGDLAADDDLYNHIQATADTLGAQAFAVATGLLRVLLLPSVHRRLISENDEQGLGKIVGYHAPYLAWPATTDPCPRSTIRKIIRQRLDSKVEGKEDMVYAWMKNGLNEDDLVTEATLQIIAGSDANATAIRSTMLLLMSNPAAYRSLQKEIDAAESEWRAMETHVAISNSNALNLPYLQAVIKEGMRAFPPAADPAPKVVPQGGDSVVIEGRTISLPGGTNICNSAWGLLHRKDIFGEDAAMFRPERWLEVEGEKLVRMQKTLELVFGYGRWQCLGMTIAKMQLNKIFYEVRTLREQTVHVLHSLRQLTMSRSF